MVPFEQVIKIHKIYILIGIKKRMFYLHCIFQDVQGFMLQLLEALSFAHDRNIAHLDIKVIHNVVLHTKYPEYLSFFFKT